MDLPISYSDLLNVNKHNFNEIALQIFHYQASENSVFNDYLRHINVDRHQINHFTDIPCLPIDFFKTHQILSGKTAVVEAQYFESSGTTGSTSSKHYYLDKEWYHASFIQGFEKVYGDISDWSILALLPNYQENLHSSLLYMVDHLIGKANKHVSGFYLHQDDALLHQLLLNGQRKTKTILFGVSFALLDILPKVDGDFGHLTIIETGGMKGRRKEITREELHRQISLAFKNAKIHSEYGMTELFSQAYLADDTKRFVTPPWMKVYLTQLDDPFQQAAYGKNGLINVIDLANVESCSFIATSDIGKMHKDGSFEVLGRYDLSEQRGCNLLIST